MATETGLSKSTVGRIWKAFGLKPHQIDTFKISNDPQFIDKVRDVVGLYLDPPEQALVLCVDEKSQIQALDRSAPVLPMMPGMPERRTHDYVRHGITTLFAALNVATGEITGSIHRRHRAAEFKKFLTKLDNTVPTDLDVHLICDNYATHKSPTITGWLSRHPRFHLHFTPTYSSWLNQVERWFGLLTDKKLRRGTHTSVPALEKDIRDWITTWNENPKPFAWNKTADEILERLTTYLQRIPGAGHCFGMPSVDAGGDTGEEEQRHDLKHPGQRLEDDRCGEQVAPDEDVVADGARRHDRVADDDADQRHDPDDVDGAVPRDGRVRLDLGRAGEQGSNGHAANLGLTGTHGC